MNSTLSTNDTDDTKNSIVIENLVFLDRSRPTTPAIELSSKPTLVADCYACSQPFDERKLYCTDCYREITEQNKVLIQQRFATLRSIREKNIGLMQRVQSTIEARRPVVDLKMEREKQLKRIKFLKDQVVHMQKAIKQDRLELEKTKHYNAERKANLINAQNILGVNKSKLEGALSHSMKQLYLENKKLFDKLAQHRKYLIAEFFSFFPFNPVSETESAIINIKVPNSSAQWPDFPAEVMAAALGYLVHMLNIITLYLDVYLPYRAEFFGSRSIIWREGSTKRYLLYNTSNNSGELRIALEMLNWNMLHLCISQGITVTVEKYEQPLSNFLAVLKSPLLGCEGPHSEDKDKHAARKGRKRTVSISSLSMPNVSSRVSHIATQAQIQRALKPDQTEQTETKPVTKKEDKDDEDFIVIQSVIPTPSQDQADINNFERAMFIDKV